MLWTLMTVLALIIALYAVLVLAIPHFGPPFVAERRGTMPWAVMAHLGGSALAMGLGPWQLNERLRTRALGRHRWIGRTYIVGVLVGGIGGLIMATASQEGFVTHMGFGILAVLWLVSTLQAYRRIRAGDQESHRVWMIRSYSLTFAAVTLRIYLPFMLGAGMSFTDAYQTVSWLCWVPNLVVAEWFIISRTKRMPARQPAT
ncbi:MAG: DUF2306 domain-containing protein [Gemmatimonadaceae bacterium]